MKKTKDPRAVALGRKGGLARGQNLTPEQLSAIGRYGANVRYDKDKSAKPKVKTFLPTSLTPIMVNVGRLTPSEQRLLLRTWRAVRVAIHCDGSLIGLPKQLQADVKLYRHWHNVYSANHSPSEAGLLALCHVLFQIVRGRLPLS